MRIRLLLATTLTCLATTVACGPTTPPQLSGLTDQVAEVGTELQITLDGADTDGARLAYSYKAADLSDLDGNAEITVSPDGTGEFRWTPLAADVGSHAFDFTVADAGATTTVTINIDVKSAIGAATAPVFRQPLGTGTTVDLSVTMCVDVDIVVDDQTSANVAIAQEAPMIDGATLTPQAGNMATWHWCPTAAQVSSADRYTLILSADDHANPKTIKNYLIVLRSPSPSSCPGQPPVIAHTPQDQTTNLDLALSATVTDDVGIKDAPLFYYATTNPGAAPDLSAMTQLTTAQASGSATDGVWVADVPSPVAGMPAGTAVTLYYLFVADDEDANGTCTHTTTSQVYSATITAGGSDIAAVCDTCSDDSQCGAGNECVLIGDTGASFCLAACSGGCGAGFTCSAAAIESIDGASAPQCVPQSGSCIAPTAQCMDDSWEINDTRSDASKNPVMAPGSYDLVSCPSTTSTTMGNEDWYKIVLPAGERIDLNLMGDGATDVDLHLYHSDATVITASTSSNPDEEINTCLPAGTYYVKVNAYGYARSLYTLDFAQTAEACDTTCVDDANEEDNTYSQARDATLLPYASDSDTICPNDDDWYHVVLFSGQTLTVDLAFTQSDPSGNLDLHLYQDGTTDLTPCSVDDPDDCSVANGQGTDSNEHTEYTVPDGCDGGCDYYVVVRGYDGATNDYSIAIDAE